MTVSIQLNQTLVLSGITRYILSVLAFLALSSESFAQNQDSFEIWKKMYANCRSLTGGKYSVQRSVKNLTSSDTIITTMNCSFKKVGSDSLFKSYFDVQSSLGDKRGANYSYNGTGFISCFEDVCTEYSGREALTDLKRFAHNFLLFHPFNNIDRSELSFVDSSELILVGDEKIGSWECLHFGVQSGLDTTSMVKILRTQSDFWINKKDLLPVKYSVYYQVDLMGVVSEQFEMLELKSYAVNRKSGKVAFRSTDYFSDKGYTMKAYTRSDRKLDKLAVGDFAPSWNLVTNKGSEINSQENKHKLVIFDFFYKSCFPCLKAIPMMNSLHEKYGNEVLIIGIDEVDAKDDNFYEFLKVRNVNYPVFVSGNALTANFRVQSYPTLFLMDEKGKILHIKEGYGENSETQLVELIDSILNKPD